MLHAALIRVNAFCQPLPKMLFSLLCRYHFLRYAIAAATLCCFVFRFMPFMRRFSFDYFISAALPPPIFSRHFDAALFIIAIVSRA